MSEPENHAINPRTGKPGRTVSGGSQDAWNPEQIARDIEAARHMQNRKAADDDKRWGFEPWNPGHIARDVEAARQKQNLEKHLPKPRGSEHGAAKRGADVETQKESPELITVSAGLKSMFGKLWNTIEDLAYGEPPEGVTREDWVKEQMARHEQHREQEAAKRRSVVKERPKAPRRDEEEDEWHDRLDSSGFWNQR
jgi:hypothetical protein